MDHGAGMEINVTLNANEILVAGYVGMRRNAEASHMRRNPHFPEKVVGELWGYHIEAAHAELAVAKTLGIYWGFGVNTFHVPDIENTNLEVRWSSRKDLKIRPDDTGIVVSVSGRCPDYTIHGWIHAEDGKKDEYRFSQHPPCFFVPHANLNPLSELKLHD
jgi:hypothetical protein